VCRLLLRWHIDSGREVVGGGGWMIWLLRVGVCVEAFLESISDRNTGT